MGETKRDSLSKDAIVYTVGNYFVKAVAVISAPIFTRLLSTDDYGQVTIYTTWLSFFGILTCMELKGTIINAFVKYGQDEYKGYIKNSITLSIFISILLEILLLLFPRCAEAIFNMPVKLCMFGIVHAFFNGMTLFLSQYLTMTGKSVKYIAVSGIQAVLNVLLSVLFIFLLPLDRYLSRITGQLVSSIIIGIAIVVFFYKNKERFLRWDFTMFAIPLAIPLLFHALSGIVLVGADKVMLDRLTTDSEVGLYGFAGSVLALLSTMTVSFYTAWRPYSFEKLKDGKEDELKCRMKSYIRCFTIVCIGFMLVQPELVKLLSEKSYWDCIPMVVPLAVGEYFYFLYTSVMNYELYHQKNIWTPVGSIGAAVINILINMVILRYMGGMGAAISTLVSNFTLWIFHDFISRKVVKGYNYPVRSYFLPVFLVIICSIFAYVTIDIPLIRWTLAICLGVVFFCRVIKSRSLF